MPGTPSRRAVLRATAGITVPLLAGCTLGNEDTEGNLFIENTRPVEHRVQLIVSTGQEISDDRVLEGWYRVPGETALEFQGVLEQRETYTIAAHAESDETSEDVSSTLEPCPGEAGTEGSRDVSVRVEEDATGIIPWGCDTEHDERNIEYVDPSEYEIEQPEDAGTWSTPEPS